MQFFYDSSRFHGCCGIVFTFEIIFCYYLIFQANLKIAVDSYSVQPKNATTHQGVDNRGSGNEE